MWKFVVRNTTLHALLHSILYLHLGGGGGWTHACSICRMCVVYVHIYKCISTLRQYLGYSCMHQVLHSRVRPRLIHEGRRVPFPALKGRGWCQSVEGLEEAPSFSGKASFPFNRFFVICLLVTQYIFCVSVYVRFVRPEGKKRKRWYSRGIPHFEIAFSASSFRHFILETV